MKAKKSKATQKKKTHKGAAKRFKVTGTGKVMRQQAGKSHILTKKSMGRKRKLRKSTDVSETVAKKIKGLLNL